VLYDLMITFMDVTGSVHLSVLNSVTSIVMWKLLIIAVVFCVLHPPWFHMFSFLDTLILKLNITSKIRK
jgi:hypothetical protein